MTKNQPQSTNQKDQVIIVGGGFVGLSQAIALAEKGIAVKVIDHETQENILKAESDGRTCAIAWKSYKFLEKIGAWQYIAPHAQPILDIRVSEFGSRLFLHFDHSDIGSDPFGFIVENHHTREGLYKRAAELPNLEIIAPARVSELKTENGELLYTKDNTVYRLPFTVLIAADGKNSQIRKMLGIADTRHDYNQTAIVCTIKHSKPHGGLAHEHFIPIGPFAVLPMQGNFSSLVWCEPPELAAIYMKMSEADFTAEIAKRINYLGDIKLASGKFGYPLELVQAAQYTKGSVVLVGDAAHGIHPIAGQGVNLGFRDVELLTDIITERALMGLPINSEAAFSQYEKLRKIDNKLMIVATHGLTKLFSNNILPIKLARTLGLGMVQQIPPLKKLFMKYAAGQKLVG